MNTGHVLNTHSFILKTGKLNNFRAYPTKRNTSLITTFLYDMALGQTQWDGQTGGHIAPVYIPYGSQTEHDKLHFKPVRQVRCQADTRKFHNARLLVLMAVSAGNTT